MLFPLHGALFLRLTLKQQGFYLFINIHIVGLKAQGCSV